MTEIDRFAELKRAEDAARSAFGDDTASFEAALEERRDRELEEALAGR